MNMNKFKIKNSYYKKVFLYSVSIIFITIAISYLLNIFFLDNFYVNRKKKIMLDISKHIDTYFINKNSLYSEEFHGYIEDVKDKYGVDINISPCYPREHRAKFDAPSDENGFLETTHKFSRAKLLIYRNNLSFNQRLTLTTSLSVMDSHKHEFNIFNILATLISIFIATIFSFIFSKKITNDIKRLNDNAKKISNMEFPKENEIIISRKDELGELSHSLYYMSKNLHTSIDSLKLFVSNASHELKTPISILKSHCEFILNNKDLSPKDLETYHKIILKTSNDMEDLVQKLLSLTKISSPNFKIEKESVILKELISHSLEINESLELQKDISFIKTLSSEPVFVEKNLFQIVFNNLIENALKYSPENSNIFINFNNMEFSIKNSILEKVTDNPQELFKTFSRGENSYNLSGYGLGLSLVKEILELHKFHYEIKLENSSFEFIIKFS